MSTVRQTEKQFQWAVLEYAHIMGWRTFHAFDSRRSTPGFPDLVLVRDEQLVFAELKTEHGRLRPEQRDWLDALERTGVRVHVWRPTNWAEITRTLDRPQIDRRSAA